jgi:hypothetical protein
MAKRPSLKRKSPGSRDAEPTARSSREAAEGADRGPLPTPPPGVPPLVRRKLVALAISVAGCSNQSAPVPEAQPESAAVPEGSATPGAPRDPSAARPDDSRSRAGDPPASPFLAAPRQPAGSPEGAVATDPPATKPLEPNPAPDVRPKLPPQAPQTVPQPHLVPPQSKPPQVVRPNDWHGPPPQPAPNRWQTPPPQVPPNPSKPTPQ